MAISEAAFKDLLEKYKRQKLSSEDLLRFLDACDDPFFEDLLGERIQKDLEEDAFADLADINTRRHIWSSLDQGNKEPFAPARQSKVLRQWRWAAAAVVVLLVGTAGYFGIIRHDKNPKQLPGTSVIAKTPVAGGNKATLVLAGGKRIPLGNQGKGLLATQDNITISENENGRLVYRNNGGEPVGVPALNKVITPKGGQYCLILSDGTKVWLNAASSLSYPVAFDGNEREVSMTGEAYFEVARNPQKPFKVRINQNAEIKVLGTHFNVNTYSNESTLKTTLLQGSIQLKVNHAIRVLTPGQQAQIDKSDNVIIAKHVDLEQVIAWKNGLFVFQRASLEELMRQIERWYNITVVYQGQLSTDLFSGSFSRSAPLSDVLKILEYSRIRYKLQGSKLIVHM